VSSTKVESEKRGTFTRVSSVLLVLLREREEEREKKNYNVRVCCVCESGLAILMPQAATRFFLKKWR
jgi:hypothetical protein